VPWSMVRLWNERWRAMSFGPYRFEANAFAAPLMLRWLLLLIGPVVLIAIGGLIAAAIGGAAMVAGGRGGMIGVVLAGLAVVAGFYLLVALIGIGYWAAYLRQAIGSLSLSGLHFQFDARSKDWLLLFLGDVALVVGTLGLGICFLGYRHWSFLIRHLGTTGEVDLAQVTQSATRAPREAEGFADAFDLGAI